MNNDSLNETRHEKTRFLPMQKQGHSNCTADLRLRFRQWLVEFLFFLNLKFQVPLPSSIAAQAGLCQTWSEILNTGFLALRLQYNQMK